MFTDLLIRVRHGDICWAQTEKSAWVSLSPAASTPRSVRTTHHLSLPPAQSTDGRSGEHCQITAGLGKFRLSFKSDDVPWFKENKTLMTGTLSPKPKWKHLDWTNGRVWWFTTAHLISVQDIFWDILQLQGQLTRIFSLGTNSGLYFSYSTCDELFNGFTCCAWDMGNKSFFSFSRHDSWFQSHHKVQLGNFMLETAGSLQHHPGEEGNHFLWGTVSWECPSSIWAHGELCCHRLWKSCGSSEY